MDLASQVPPGSVGVSRQRGWMASVWMTLLLAMMALLSPPAAIAQTSTECGREETIEGTVSVRGAGVFVLHLPETEVAEERNVEIRVNGSTVVRNAAEQVVTFDAVTVGARARVRYCTVSRFAIRIDLQGPSVPPVEEEAESEGNIEQVMDAPFRIVVGSRVWVLNNLTEVVNDEGAPLAFSALRVGVFVEVAGLVPSPGTSNFRAQRVEVRADDESEQPELNIVGPIRSISTEGRSFRVNDLQILTENSTIFRLKPRNGETREITFAQLRVGQVVKVEGVAAPQIATAAIFPAPAPAILAHEVTVQEDLTTPPTPPNPQAFSVRGFLQRVTDGGALILGDNAIRTNDATVYTDAPTSSTISLADLIPGDFLHVEGVITSAGRTALTVVRTTPVGVPVSAFGEIRFVGEYRLRVGERNFVLTDATVVLGANDVELTIADLAVGQRVEVTGTEIPGRLPVAERVVIRSVPRPVCEKNTEFRGAIESINGDRILVAGRSVGVTSTTEIRNRDERPLLFSALEVGMVVRVEGNAVPNAGPIPAVQACEIRVVGDEPSGPSESTRLIGTVAEVNPTTNSLVVRDVTVLVNETTEILARRDDEGTTRTLSDIEVGDLVEVRGNRLSNGTFVARRIVIQEERVPQPPPQIVVRWTGLVSGIDLPTSLTVGGRAIQIPTGGEFKIEGLDGEVSSLEDLQVGDLVIVKGSRTGDGPIVAREIEVRAAVLTNIDTTARVLTLNGLDVQTTTATLYLTRTTRPASRIGFEDLAVGDLLRVHGRKVSGGLVAREVVQIRTAGFLEDGNDQFVPPIPGVEDGRPTLTTGNNTDTFGFISLPEGSFPIEENALFEITARVRGNVTNPGQVPTVRLRSNNASFQKGHEFIVDSNGPSDYVPTPEGRVIRSYFVPAQPPANALQLLRNWFASLDVINFGGLNQAIARLRLDDIQVRAIALSRINVVATVAEHSFDTGTEGWEFSPVGGNYSTPVSNSGVAGSLDLVPVAANAVGWWTGSTDAVIEGNTLYRGRFLVRTSASDGAKVPTFRVRLNLKSLQLASVVVISSTGNGEESPTAEGRLYDVYLYVPGPVVANEGIFASFDLVHTDSSDELAPVSLDHFTLEKLEILPE